MDFIKSLNICYQAYISDSPINKKCKLHPWVLRNIIIDRTHVTYNKIIPPSIMVPIELLWEVFKNIQKDSRLKIIKDKLWDIIGIPFSIKDRENEVILILDQLSAHGYIIFQRAGSVWSITLSK